LPSPVFVAFAAFLMLPGCARTGAAHTPGEIPRDGYGRPIWSLIDPSGAQRPS